MSCPAAAELSRMASPGTFLWLDVEAQYLPLNCGGIVSTWPWVLSLNKFPMLNIYVLSDTRIWTEVLEGATFLFFAIAQWVFFFRFSLN